MIKKYYANLPTDMIFENISKQAAKLSYKNWSPKLDEGNRSPNCKNGYDCSHD